MSVTNCYKYYYNARGRQTGVSVVVTNVTNVISMQKEDRRVYQ